MPSRRRVSLKPDSGFSDVASTSTVNVIPVLVGAHSLAASCVSSIAVALQSGISAPPHMATRSSAPTQGHGPWVGALIVRDIMFTSRCLRSYNVAKVHGTAATVITSRPDGCRTLFSNF